MALTRAQVSTILNKRIGPLFTELGLDGTTTNSNTDHNDPIGYAIRKLGGTVATITAVADSDLASIEAANYDELLDLAELRCMQTALSTARRLVSYTLGPKREEYADIAKGLAVDIARKQDEMKEEYGRFNATLEAGVITLAFAEENEE